MDLFWVEEERKGKRTGESSFLVRICRAVFHVPPSIIIVFVRHRRADGEHRTGLVVGGRRLGVGRGCRHHGDRPSSTRLSDGWVGTNNSRKHVN